MCLCACVFMDWMMSQVSALNNNERQTCFPLSFSIFLSFFRKNEQRMHIYRLCLNIFLIFLRSKVTKENVFKVQIESIRNRS